MSILIKGMKMPRGFGYCPFCDYEQSHCLADNDTKTHGWVVREPWCPLVEIPKHGRLIDGDAVIDKMCLDYTAAERNGKLMYTSVKVKQGFCDLLTDAPTVIEAEE